MELMDEGENNYHPQKVITAYIDIQDKDLDFDKIKGNFTINESLD